VQRYSDHGYLALLDGETQVSNVVHVATTVRHEPEPEQLRASTTTRSRIIGYSAEDRAARIDNL
jgi:hypothetical protein